MTKKLIILFSFTLLLFVSCRSLNSSNNARSGYPEEALGWKLGAQTYTFNRFSFIEALDKIDSCGLKYVEAYSTQNVGGGIEGKMDFRMSAEKRKLILAQLKSRGLKLEAYGVVKGRNPDEWRQLFEFCKAMGIKTITSEPAKGDLPLISKLCDEFKINLAIHNHPKPSIYWNPDVVLSTISGHSKRVGACADIGHWVRSGLDPVESLKKLDGHILHLHMKDLNERNERKAHDVHWGTGVSNIKGVVEELKRQDFQGMLSVEYEYNWFNSGPDVAASVRYFRSIVK